MLTTVNVTTIVCDYRSIVTVLCVTMTSGATPCDVTLQSLCCPAGQADPCWSLHHAMCRVVKGVSGGASSMATLLTV